MDYYFKLIVFVLCYLSFFSTLSLVEDPRMDRRKLHPLDFILLIVFTSTIYGCNSWYDIEDYAEYWQDDLKQLYKKLTGQDVIHGIPSHDSLNMAISLLEPEVFEEVYSIWPESFVQLTSGSHICIDGKSMRCVRKLSFDAQSHTVSAYSPKESVSIAQVYIDKKDSELNAIEILLDKLDPEGNLFSIDAIATQTDLAKTISSRGDYLLPVKDNQLHGKQELEDFFCPHFAKHIVLREQTELGHGRIETRRYESIVNLLDLEDS
ncbi:ISAs1 family transposase [Porphyromonas sp.]|uniref:ISAs1 family transposase n=1 Tax=Porphyromonas sp. TaxID=1924944 RepID=UPI0026DB6266|nr:ISAs1 family transposase [Porphyromonas sp.]MDO4771263.1 ISAs1 family transposase [Porphyromonas sp.]